MVSVVVASSANAADFETPPDEPAAKSLPAELITSPDFHVSEPVQSDGLMHHYVLVSRFGEFAAYGRTTLAVRVREVAALARIAKTTDVDVVVKTVTGRVQGDVKTITQAGGDPIKTVVGIPTGVSHLFNGYKAEAGELTGKVQQRGEPGANSHVAKDVKADATRYADRYLGVSAAERRYYQQLGVDPYTNNEVLRKAVHRLAKVDAAVNLGMHSSVFREFPISATSDARWMRFTTRIQRLCVLDSGLLSRTTGCRLRKSDASRTRCS